MIREDVGGTIEVTVMSYLLSKSLQGCFLKMEYEVPLIAYA